MQPEQATDWIAASYSIARLPRHGAPHWITEFLSENGALPPIAVVSDLGRLFAGTTLREAALLPQVGERLRNALRAYEDHVLGRMGAAPIFQKIRDVFVVLPPLLKVRASSLLIQRFLSRIGFENSVPINFGLLRKVIDVPADEMTWNGLQALRESDELTDMISASLEEITQSSRHQAELLLPSDVFLMEHIEALADLGDRLLIEQLSEVQDAFQVGLPKRFKTRRRPLQAKVRTAMSADEEFPAGGFSSISNSGSLENLVISELIYMNDESDDKSAIDLFDLRYAEGELLYYTRDDAVFHRDHRVIQFLLQPDLRTTSVKDEELDWQQLVIALGLLLCAVDRLSDWLSEQGLTIRIAFLTSAEHSPLTAEKKVLELLLHAWIERGVVEITEESNIENIWLELSERARGAEVDVISLGADHGHLGDVSEGYQLAQLVLGDTTPRLSWRHRAHVRIAESTDPQDSRRTHGKRGTSDAWHEWQQISLRLLSELV